MRSTPRRMMFQLVSLFDMLMIIIFAQYLDVRERAETRIGLAEAQAQAAELAAREQIRMLQEQLAAQTLAGADAQELAKNLASIQSQLKAVADLVGRVFSIPDKQLNELFRAESTADLQRLKELLKQLSDSQGAAVVRHALAFSELEKRCDLWDLHIDDSNEFVLRSGTQVYRFRGETRAAFEAGLFRAYRSMPQPKQLVIILCTWGWNTSIRTRQAAYDGLPAATGQMTTDSDRRSRFEFAWLGPLAPPAR